MFRSIPLFQYSNEQRSGKLAMRQALCAVRLLKEGGFQNAKIKSMFCD
jgi:hypothetical protein